MNLFDSDDTCNFAVIFNLCAVLAPVVDNCVATIDAFCIRLVLRLWDLVETCNPARSGRVLNVAILGLSVLCARKGVHRRIFHVSGFDTIMGIDLMQTVICNLYCSWSAQTA